MYDREWFFAVHVMHECFGSLSREEYSGTEAADLVLHGTCGILHHISQHAVENPQITFHKISFIASFILWTLFPCTTPINLLSIGTAYPERQCKIQNNKTGGIKIFYSKNLHLESQNFKQQICPK